MTAGILRLLRKKGAPRASTNGSSVPPPDPAAFVSELVERLGRGQEALIPILQAIQRQYRYLPEAALRQVVRETSISATDIMGAATFYSQFRLKPVGRHIISVCHGTACHVKGAGIIDDALRRHLRLPHEDDTDSDGLFTVTRVACLGCCTLAPVMQIDGLTYGYLTTDNVGGALDDFLALERSGALSADGDRGSDARTAMGEVRLALDSCCIAGGTMHVRDAVAQAARDLHVPVAVRGISCSGLCHQIPLVEVAAPGKAPVMYARFDPRDAEALLRRHFKPSSLAARIRQSASGLLDRIANDETWEPVTRYAVDMRDPPICAYLGPQKRIAMEHAGEAQPLDLDAYVAREGFVALRRCLTEMTPEQAIDEVKRSGLRGRGGAGFPTGIKWERVRAAGGSPKYVICNGDEGDPGAFMDRMLLESFPFRVLEGIAIAAYAVGAEEGVLYVRAEYPHAVRRITEAIRLCEEAGYLGDGILGTMARLHLRLLEGAGAFVCGEETALIASIEGRRGVPTLRPPYPSESGLWGKPTSINNVETYALVPWIFRKGAEAFAALGTETSKGTKVFALAGKVRRGGLIEVPMGVTIRQIVEEIGGGVPDGATFKAVQIGGPSGGCLPASLADTPVDYNALVSAGAIMGSGGMVVLDDRTCMVDIARYFLSFTQHESCGKCTFCRVGTKRMLEVLERLCAGQGRKSDLTTLEELSGYVKQGSLCGLGQTAPNPVLTGLRYFRDEYEAHIEGRCPAGVCKALIHYEITPECIGCTICAQQCPVDAIPMRPFARHVINDDLCTRCDACRRGCPENAIVIRTGNDIVRSGEPRAQGQEPKAEDRSLSLPKRGGH
jgi:NADH-quinone oxidoreductase subunit F